jgi:hypothetical protein
LYPVPPCRTPITAISGISSANQANAHQATGPRTPQGKAKSPRYSLRHGFRSQSVLLSGDDPAEYEALLAELEQHFIPRDLVDQRSVREMADAEWSLRRCRQHQEEPLSARIEALHPHHPGASPIALQAFAYDALHRESGSLAQLMRYETRFQPQYDKARRARRAKRTQFRRSHRPQRRLPLRLRPQIQALLRTQCARPSQLPERLNEVDYLPGRRNGRIP